MNHSRLGIVVGIFIAIFSAKSMAQENVVEISLNKAQKEAFVSALTDKIQAHEQMSLEQFKNSLESDFKAARAKMPQDTDTLK